jgi:hypothetical protein
MSLLSQQSQVNADSAFFAPASGGGGGGGAGGPNLTVSTLTVNTSLSGTSPSGLQITSPTLIQQNGTNGPWLTVGSAGGNNGYVTIEYAQDGNLNEEMTLQIVGWNEPENYLGGLEIQTNATTKSATVIQGYQNGPIALGNVSSINGAQYPPASTDVFSTIQVSSINGSQYPPAATDVFSTLSVSSLNGITNVTGDMYFSTSKTLDGGGGGTGNDGGYLYNWKEVTTGSINTNQIGAQSTAAITLANDLSGGGQIISAGTILTSSINGLQSMGTPAGTQLPGGFQCGYVAGVPYASTILFPHPYPDDKVCVTYTPTNAGVPGGPYPNYSLSWVSSIGFSPDFRYSGVGQTGNFYWMAYPWTN